jgi:hypothetical protein
MSIPSNTVNGNYLNIQDSFAAGGALFRAGYRSVDTGNNDGWLFGSRWTDSFSSKGTTFTDKLSDKGTNWTDKHTSKGTSYSDKHEKKSTSWTDKHSSKGTSWEDKLHSQDEAVDCE